MGLFATIRAILELLYFASGVAIAIFAFRGLAQIKLGVEQLKITKEIAKTNSKREAVKLAGEMCRYFSEEPVKQRTEWIKQYSSLHLKYLTVTTPQNQPPFAIMNGEITNHNFDLKALSEELPKSDLAVPYLNCLEAFAIPFASGLADEEVGYRETARPFCQCLTEAMPVLFEMRRLNYGRFESAVKLYEMWSRRLAAEAAAPVMQVMGELVKKAASERIKPLDHEF